MSTGPRSYDGKLPPSMVGIYADNESEVVRLCSGEYLAGLDRPDGLQPAWTGILYCIERCASASRSDTILRGMSDAKTVEALRGLAATNRSNALYRLRAVAKFLSDAAEVVGKMPPSTIAGPMRSFFSGFADRVTQVASALVMRRSGRSVVGVVQWDFPLPTVQLRTTARPSEWPSSAVAPAIRSKAWFTKYPIERPEAYPMFESGLFLNAAYEQLLNMVSAIRVGSAKDFQDATLKKTRDQAWKFISGQASISDIFNRVDSRLALSLFYCFSYSWFESGFGPDPSGKITKRLDTPPYSSEMTRIALGTGERTLDPSESVPWGALLLASAAIGGVIYLTYRLRRTE